ncbi:MAG: hypothetical protein ACOC04_05620 [Halothece sp.]
MSDQEKILQKAKSGDPQAIVILLNHTLKAKGISITRHELKGDCLKLLLQSEKEINHHTQEKIVNFIQKILVRKLNLNLIKTVLPFWKS